MKSHISEFGHDGERWAEIVFMENLRTVPADYKGSYIVSPAVMAAPVCFTSSSCNH